MSFNKKLTKWELGNNLKITDLVLKLQEYFPVRNWLGSRKEMETLTPYIPIIRLNFKNTDTKMFWLTLGMNC